MCEKSGYCYRGTCSSLTARINEIRGQLKVAEQNAILKQDCIKQKERQERNIMLCSRVIEASKPIVAEIKNYMAARKEESLHNLNNALRISCEIIPDARKGIHIEIDKDSATVVDQDGCPVQEQEGGGYRQVSSAFLRHAVLSMAPQFLNTMFLDETFALVNEENSATLSLYLQLMSKTSQVISIEQKEAVYSNMDYRSYHFTKTEVWSTVERIEHVTSDIEQAV